MKLITLGKTDGTYKVKASISYKLAGLTIINSIEEFTLFENQEWRNIHGKRVSGKKAKYLNSWLKDHQKFIENE